MDKKILKMLFSIPAALMIYMPILLLLIEYNHIPLPQYEWIRYTAAFILFWSGWTVWGWAFYALSTKGKGTLSPTESTEELVRSGPYQYVRNPMALSTVAVLCGEALYFDAVYLYIWVVAVVFFYAIYIPRYEEPRLLEKFGQRYMEYRADVDRYI